MDTENTRLRWEQEEAAVRQRIEAAGAKAGVARHEQIAAHAALLGGESWTIYDNTASGAATGNALELQALV